MGKLGVRGTGSQRRKPDGRANGLREGPGGWNCWAGGPGGSGPRASRLGGIVALGFPSRVPGTNALTVAWPQGLRRCYHIRVLTSKMGHSLRDARVLGLSLLYEHTSKEKESDREIWGPLHYAASDSHPCIASMPQLFPQTFSNHNTPRWPHFLCLCGLFSVKALTLGQDLLNLQWLIVAIVVAQQRLSRQPLPRFTTGRALWVPLAGPVCSAFLLALSYFCPFSHCSPVCVHQRPRSYCAANSVGLALVTGYSAGRVGHIWRELPICADVFKCNQK